MTGGVEATDAIHWREARTSASDIASEPGGEVTSRWRPTSSAPVMSSDPAVAKRCGFDDHGISMFTVARGLASGKGARS